MTLLITREKFLVCWAVLLVLVVSGCSKTEDEETGTEPNLPDAGESEPVAASTETELRATHYTPFDEEVAGPGGVELSIAVSTEEKGPVLVFIAKNNTNKEFVTTELREGHNRIAVWLPSGKYAGADSWWSNRAARAVVAPSESREWRLDAQQLLKYFKEEGLYRIRWKVGKLESQDLLLLKEE